MARRGTRVQRRSDVDHRGRALAALLALGFSLLAGPVAFAQTTPTDPPPTAPPSSEAPVTSDVPPLSDPGTTSLPTGPTTSTLARPPAVPTPGGFGGPPPPDPDAPPEPPMADPSPQVRVLITQLRAQHHLGEVAAVEQRLAEQQAVEDQANAAVEVARADVAAAEALIAADHQRLRTMALYAYIDPGASPLEQILASEATDERPRDVLLRVSVDHTRDVLRQDEATLRARQRTLAQREGTARTEAAHTQVAADRLTAARDQQALLERNISQAVSDQRQGVPYELPILGLNVFTPEELAAWFAHNGVRSRAQTSMAELAAFYLQEGRDEGVRGDMAFAQSVLETGSFTNDDTIRFNNFAGVGHCDSCPTGFAFASPQLGVRGQIQLLKQYSEGNVTYRHPLVDRRLRGPAGCCQTWTDLTHIWATNGNYGPKIMTVYREMLHWLVLQRGLTPLDAGP